MKIDKDSYGNGHLVDITNAKLSQGWNLDTSWHPEDGAGTRANFVNVPMLIATEPNGTVKLHFRGSAVGIAVAAGPDAGMIEYRVDRHKWIKLNLFTKMERSVTPSLVPYTGHRIAPTAAYIGSAHS